tara:strand:+ start:293 stop:928 length:636 start_codon:yes stop_codon:yes gene_type:complete
MKKGLLQDDRMDYAEGGEIITMPDSAEMPVASNEETMASPMSTDIEMPLDVEMPMESDSEMEDGFLEFIITEALSPEEEEMLMSKLEQDEQLSMIFDKVIDVAQEFAGSGPVEGPGSGVSDSIPARLSDGEFVFTAKAVEEIGEDTLMSMMKEAEANAEGRQELAIGGSPMSEEEKVLEGVDVTTDDSERVKRKINDNMLDPTTQRTYVRS